MGLGGYPGSDRQFLGMLGMHGHYEANMAMHHCDVLLAVGARFDDRVTNTPEKFCPEAKIIHVDVDNVSIDKIIRADVPILGLATRTLEALLAAVQERMPAAERPDLAPWWEQVERWRQEHGLLYGRRYPERDGVIMPQRVIEVLYEVTGGDAWITSDVGQHQMFAAQYYRFDKPRRWINSGGLGTMGFGFPRRHGRASRGSWRRGGLRDRGGQHTDDAAGNVHLSSVRSADQDLSTLTTRPLAWSSSGRICSMVAAIPTAPTRIAPAGFVCGWRKHTATRECAWSVPEELEPAMRECFAMKDKLVFMDVMVDPDEHV